MISSRKKSARKNVGTPNIRPASTPRKGFYIVDSVLACYPNWPQYAVAWTCANAAAAVRLARDFNQADGKDFIVIDETGYVVFAGGDFL